MNIQFLWPLKVHTLGFVSHRFLFQLLNLPLLFSRHSNNTISVMCSSEAWSTVTLEFYIFQMFGNSPLLLSVFIPFISKEKDYGQCLGHSKVEYGLDYHRDCSAYSLRCGTCKSPHPAFGSYSASLSHVEARPMVLVACIIGIRHKVKLPGDTHMRCFLGIVGLSRNTM